MQSGTSCVTMVTGNRVTDKLLTAMRILSGIQPTGRFHWGNYFGAIRQYIALQDGNEAYYFIANLHALTTVREPARLRQATLDAALDLLALGLDPARATLFVQSDVPEVSELCWLLMTGAPLGLLERCVAFKEKKAKGLTADAGLFTYPVLMAADILAYDADLVPVGEDQVQHIEVCRDLARSFNHLFGEVFAMPRAQVMESSAKVPGTDGEKMSKSYDNTIEIFEEPAAVRKKVMRITTDSRPMEEPKDPETDHLFQLYSLFVDEAQSEEMAATVPTRWLRLRHRQERTGGGRRAVFQRGPRPAPGTGERSRTGWSRSWRTAPRARAARPRKSCDAPSRLAGSRR